MMNYEMVIENLNSVFKGNNEEIQRLRAEVESLREENRILRQKKQRPNYGVRSFVDKNGKTWYVLTDLVVSAGFAIPGMVKTVGKRVHYGTIRKFSYGELVDKIDEAPRSGVRCIDEAGYIEFINNKEKRRAS